MKLVQSKSKNSTSFYIVEGYRNKDGTSTSRIVQRLGTLKSLQEQLGPDVDVVQWCKDYVKKLNNDIKANKIVPETITLIPNTPYDKNERRAFNVGYLILQNELYKLGLSKLMKELTDKYQFKFDLEKIFADLIYSRILEPSSKSNSYEYCKNNLLEEPNYELHNIYRALSVLEKENEYIQNFFYDNTRQSKDRKYEVFFYDCTNFFFEITTEDNLRRYGRSKENRPNPIVQFGMFMDSDGIPLGFSLFPGNESEQPSLIPLEQRIIKDFELQNSKLIICTDAGLCSFNNKKFNSYKNRNFITTNPIRKMSNSEQEWVLSRGRSLLLNPIKEDENPELVKRDLRLNGWRVDDSDNYISLDDIDETNADNFNKIYYKEKYIKVKRKVDGKEQEVVERIIVTYSLKYKAFLQHKRAVNLERARKMIANQNSKKIDFKANDEVRKFIKSSHETLFGDKADINKYEIDEEAINLDSQYDGFYAVSTSIDMDEMPVSQIIQTNKGRWEIEENFMLMKSEFKSRPVDVQTEEHITAHFLTCFVSLLLFRTLERKVNALSSTIVTANVLIKTLRDMNITKLGKNHYCGGYMRTDVTDILYDISKIRFDCELITPSFVRQAIKRSRKNN